MGRQQMLPLCTVRFVSNVVSGKTKLSRFPDFFLEFRFCDSVSR